MGYSKINKIKYVTLVIILPFIILILCMKGAIGNFDSAESMRLIEKESVYEFSGHPFEFSRTRSLFSATVSIANNLSFSISKEQVTFARGDIGRAGERYFSWAPPGTTLFGALFFKIFSIFNLGQIGAYLSIVFVSVAINYLIVKIVFTYIKRDLKTSLLCAYLYTFGSIVFVYSITYFQHQYTILFLLIMLFGILETARNKKDNSFSYILPLVYGTSVFFDYPNIIILLPSMIAFLIVSNMNKKILLRSIIFILLPISILLLFQQTQFDNAFQTTNTLASGFNNVTNISLTQKDKNNIIDIFSIENTFYGIYNYIFSSKRGFFFFSPIMILGLLYIKPMFNKRPQLTSLLIATSIVTIFLYASFSAPLGGWCFGARYLLPVYLVASIFTGLWINNQKICTKILISPLILLSIANNLSGALSTITIPESMDTTFFGIKNLDFVLNNVSGSIIYKTLFGNIELIYYFIALLILISIIFFYLLFSKNTIRYSNKY